MTIEENKSLVRRYFEDAPQHAEVCNEIFATPISWHALHRTSKPNFLSSPQMEQDSYVRHKTLWGGWSEIIDEMIAEGDRVMVRWTFRGTHQGNYLGVPPTHLPITFSGIYIFRIVEGRIAEVWNLWDQVGEWQQLGILPETEDILSEVRSKHSTD